MRSAEERSCRQWCWILAGVIGLISAILLMWLASWGLVGSIFAGVVTAIILGALLNWTICSGAGVHDSAAQTAAGTAALASGAGAAAVHNAAAPSDEGSEAGAVQAADENEAADAAADMSGTASETQVAASERSSAEFSGMKSSASLPGEDDLASRKGSWKYEGAEAESSGGETEEAAPEMSDKVADQLAAGENVDLTDYDGDGVSEGSEEGTRPQALSGPRDGQGDDLKQIKGVGPKMEQLLNSLGFYHFDQIAGWTASEVAWVDANLQGFKGRVSRDNWVEQARILAEGGETEFSKRVEDGAVY